MVRNTLVLLSVINLKAFVLEKELHYTKAFVILGDTLYTHLWGFDGAYIHAKR
jgi:hypothetical protein